MKKKWRKSIRNCEAYNTFISLESDHRIVVATIVEETMSERYAMLVEEINMTEVGCMRQAQKLKIKLNFQDPRIINARESITTAYKALCKKKKCQRNHTLYK